MSPRRLATAATLLLVFTTNLHAQHDPHRNAMRHVAKGRFQRAANALKKAKKGDPETHYVLTVSLLRQNKTAEAVREAKKALDAGLPFERFVAGPRGAMRKLYETDDYRKWLAMHKPSPILHGPMLGRMTSSSVALWLRTRSAAKVAIQVLQGDKIVATSKPVSTQRRSDFTAVLTVDGLNAETTYQYQVRINDKAVKTLNASFTTYPKLGSGGKFNVCFGGGAGYVPKWEYMWKTIGRYKPAAMLMLGDNVYIDDPTQRLTNRYCYYRRQARTEWRGLTASTAFYSIYDDHDFGLNDCVPGPEIERPKWKRKVWNLFRQNWVNPAYGGGTKQPGCWYDFSIGDVHFIMLDGRYYRSRGEQLSMLGPVQNEWLRKTLKRSKGTFKIIASPVPWSPGVKPGSKDTWDGFAEEREAIFRFVATNKIEGVFLIAADRHRTDLRVTRRKTGYDLYEFESSKLTNRHTHRVVKTPGLIWGYNKTCSFGLMRFDTTAKDPVVHFDAMTIDDKRIHTFTLRRNQLK